MRKRVTNWLERGGPRLPFLLLPDARAADCHRPSPHAARVVTPSKYRRAIPSLVQSSVQLRGEDVSVDLGDLLCLRYAEECEDRGARDVLGAGS